MNFRESIQAAKVSGPENAADGAIAFTFSFPAADPTFAGHFPQRPILPGIFQIELARYAAELSVRQPLRLGAVIKAKFLRPILPEEVIRVELKCGEKTAMLQVRASFSVRGQPAGEAILRLIPEA